MEQVTEGGRVAVRVTNDAAQVRREFLPDGFFEDSAAHDGAGCAQTIEVATGGLVETAVGFVGGGRGDDAFAKVGGALHGWLDQLKKFEGEGGAEKIVLLGIEGTLDFLPRGGGTGCWLKTGQRGETLPGMMDESLVHLGGEHVPAGYEGFGGLLVAIAEFVVDDSGEDFAKLGEAACTG